MLERLAGLEKEFADVEARLADPDVFADQSRYREFAREEVETATADIDRLESELKFLLLPTDPNDDRNVIVEIRGAEGGDEANLFARDLFQMYQGFAQRMGWKLEVLGSDPSQMGGFNEITFVL